MRYSVDSSPCLYLNPVLLPNFSRASCKTSCSISELLYLPTLRPNTRIYKYSPYIILAIREATSSHYFIKTAHLFHKNVTSKTRQDGHSLLPVTTPGLTLHKRNSLLLPLPPPLVSMLFLDPQTTVASRPLLLASYLTTVTVRCLPDLFHNYQDPA